MRISTSFSRQLKISAWIFGALFSLPVSAHETLVELIPKIKPSVVGIGLFDPLSAPKTELLATGFAVMDGRYIATNAHAVPTLDLDRKQQIAVLVPGLNQSRIIAAELVITDKTHDLALLKMTGQRLPALQLGLNTGKEGLSVAFTGFPIGPVLGLNPVTHRGMISAIAPVMLPVPVAGTLSASQLKTLRNPYDVYQLDATAYPGNSGSPVYDVHSGHVIAVINKVLLTSNKESALSAPSGITYAIPAQHLQNLINSISHE